jgi:hypothetical protein
MCPIIVKMCSTLCYVTYPPLSRALKSSLVSQTTTPYRNPFSLLDRPNPASRTPTGSRSKCVSRVIWNCLTGLMTWKPVGINGRNFRRTRRECSPKASGKKIKISCALDEQMVKEHFSKWLKIAHFSSKKHLFRRRESNPSAIRTAKGN